MELVYGAGKLDRRVPEAEVLLRDWRVKETRPQERMGLVNKQGLRVAVFWELSQDDDESSV